jgi:hypothetical protein
MKCCPLLKDKNVSNYVLVYIKFHNIDPWSQISPIYSGGGTASCIGLPSDCLEFSDDVIADDVIMDSRFHPQLSAEANGDIVVFKKHVL